MKKREQPSPTAVCLTADFIGSRLSADRQALQEQLRGSIEVVNRTLADRLLVPFSVTLGDEWQGLARDVETVITADLMFRRSLRLLPFCAGIGVGGIATAIRPRTSEMDGPCFHMAREALERAAKRKGPATSLRTATRLFDDTVEGYMTLLHTISQSWTPKQIAVLDAYEVEATEVKTAERLGVSQPTVHQSLVRSHARTYLYSSAALLRFAAAYPTGRLDQVRG